MAKHGYSGNCTPGSAGNIGYETFSVGVFEVVEKASGKGTKRGGPVKVRVRGRSINPQPVYDEAQRIVDQLDAGLYFGPKNVVVKK